MTCPLVESKCNFISFLPQSPASKSGRAASFTENCQHLQGLFILRAPLEARAVSRRVSHGATILRTDNTCQFTFTFIIDAKYYTIFLRILVLTRFAASEYVAVRQNRPFPEHSRRWGILAMAGEILKDVDVICAIRFRIAGD